MEDLTMKLPVELEGDFEGKHIKVTNIANWTKTKVFIDGNEIKGAIIQAIDINLEVDALTEVSIRFKDRSVLGK